MEKRRLLLELWSRGPEEAAMELWSRGGYQWICGGEEAAQELWSKEDASIYQNYEVEKAVFKSYEVKDAPTGATV